MWIATRSTKADEFGDVKNLTNLNSPEFDGQPNLSRDGLRLYFSSKGHRAQQQDIFVASWLPEEETFGRPTPVQGQVNTGVIEFFPVISSDELALYFTRDGDLYVAKRTEKNQPFDDETALHELNTANSNEIASSVSSDGLTLFFSRTDFETFGRPWTSTRESRDSPFGQPVPMPPPMNVGFVGQPHISADWPAPGSKLYFGRCSPCEIYEATWHSDCNGNFVDDLEEISDGDADDVNANDIPDECEDEIPVRFRRGDSNADGKVNIADGVATLGFLFAGNQAPPCLDAADADDNGKIDIGDSIRTFNWLFLGGASPEPPGHQACGVDPTADDALDCAAGCP